MDFPYLITDLALVKTWNVCFANVISPSPYDALPLRKYGPRLRNLVAILCSGSIIKMLFQVATPESLERLGLGSFGVYLPSHPGSQICIHIPLGS